jgi:hypothetical protein
MIIKEKDPDFGVFAALRHPAPRFAQAPIRHIAALVTESILYTTISNTCFAYRGVRWTAGWLAAPGEAAAERQQASRRSR